MIRTALVILLFLLAQQNISLAKSISDTTKSSKENYLKIYLDGLYEYSDYIKKEVTYVNYVRERFEADVHLLVTSQNTGSGGTEFTLFYLGQHRFEGKSDTFKYVANTNNTDDETRQGLTEILKLGLIRFVAYLPQANKISIQFSDSSQKTEAANPVDKWKNWVFSLNINGYGNGQKSYSDFTGYGNISADKVTDEWKINLGLSGSLHKSHFESADFVYDSKTDSKSAYALVVNSISEHWSLGGSTNTFHSSYSNYQIQTSVSPTVEFDVFPYSKSTAKLFTFTYKVTPSYQIYIDTTIYNKKEEFLVAESLQAFLQLQQKWGSVFTSVNASHYFNDLTKYEVNLNTGLQWRIIGGLSTNLYGGVSLIHNQLNLPKYGATDEELLTQQKELSTSYSYYASIGISYTFGSIFNNVVNPRFGQE